MTQRRLNKEFNDIRKDDGAFSMASGAGSWVKYAPDDRLTWYIKLVSPVNASHVMLIRIQFPSRYPFNQVRVEGMRPDGEFRALFLCEAGLEIPGRTSPALTVSQLLVELINVHFLGHGQQQDGACCIECWTRAKRSWDDVTSRTGCSAELEGRFLPTYSHPPTHVAAPSMGLREFITNAGVEPGASLERVVEVLSAEDVTTVAVLRRCWGRSFDKAKLRAGPAQLIDDALAELAAGSSTNAPPPVGAV